MQRACVDKNNMTDIKFRTFFVRTFFMALKDLLQCVVGDSLKGGKCKVKICRKDVDGCHQKSAIVTKSTATSFPP